MYARDQGHRGNGLPTLPTTLAAGIERSLRETTELLRRLLAGLRERRGAWASVRPGTLAPSAELEQVAGRLAELEQQRVGALEQIAQSLPPLPGAPASARHLNVSALAELLPAPAAGSLRAAAAAAASIARDVRGEVAFGQRILAFTARVQDQVLQQLGADRTVGTAATGYDRHARLRGAGAAVRTGGLVDGRI